MNSNERDALPWSALELGEGDARCNNLLRVSPTKPGPGPDCIGFIDAQLIDDEKARVLARLNKRRTEAARGARGMPKASNMLKLVWVEELAREAQRWADQCAPVQTPEENDFCRDLYSTPVGQCVVSMVGEAPGLRPESLVDVWHMQSIHYPWNVSYNPPSKDGPNYADYAQIIWAKSYMVGCARSRFMGRPHLPHWNVTRDESASTRPSQNSVHVQSPWRGRLRSVERLVCNLAPRGPQPGLPLWSPGPEGTECPPLSKPDFENPALCAFHSDLEDTELPDAKIKETILLNTVLEIEDNKPLNFLGNLDQTYLSRMNMIAQLTNETRPNLPSLRKRDLSQISMKPFINTETHVPTLINSETDVGVIEKEITRTKAYVVGRPIKPYDLEELDHVERNTENILEDKEYAEQLSSNKDLYTDYTDCTSSLTDSTDITHTSPSEYLKSTLKFKELEAETAIDLQTALDQRENELSSTTSEDLKKGKSRREVKDPDTPFNNNKSDDVDDEDNDDDSQNRDDDGEDNELEEKILRVSTTNIRMTTQKVTNLTATEPTPSMDVVKQFLPFLQQFERNILGSSSRASVSTYYLNTVTTIAIFLFNMF